LIIVLIHIQVNKSDIDAFRDVTIANGKTRQQSDGNLRYDVFQDEADPTQFTMIEVFESQETIDAYYETPAYHTWYETVKPMIVDIRGSDQTQIYP